MIRRPPRSTLFPTRRSSDLDGTVPRPADRGPLGGRRAGGVGRIRNRECGPANLPNMAAADRKSTRLNSSHGYISYAVFCLKKKKKIETDTTLMNTADRS